MKVGLTAHGDGTHIAVLRDGQWIDFSAACEAQNSATVPSSLWEILVSGDFQKDYFDAVLHSLDKDGSLKDFILSPTPQFLLPFRPGKIVALGRNYRAHAKELGNDAPDEPLFFSKSATACIGDGEPIVVKDIYGRVDHEGELAIVIGKIAKDIRPEDAQGIIAGYTLLNDVTARELQKTDIEKGHPWYRSKNLDTFCPVGPVIALPEALPWPVKVEIQLQVNGETRQKSNTSKFIFTIPETLAYISSFMTLEPGDLVSTGTPEGVSPIYPGDEVSLSVPEIGVLRNPVVAP